VAALLADRFAALEASLPRVAAGTSNPPARPTSAAAELEAIWSLPGIVSLHRN
jgi:hypothetical protein